MFTLALGTPKVGCVTCKIRRKKCDQRKPNCAACERNVLICVYPPRNTYQVKRASQQRSHEDTHSTPTKSISQAPRSIRGCEDRRNANLLRLISLTRPESSFLHNYFLNCTARMLSAAPTEHSLFVKILLPIAAWSDTVLQAVLSLSGVHYEAQHSPNRLVATYEHSAQALRGLKYGLTKIVSGQTELALELAFTTLLFCFIECIRGDTDGNAFRHLNAARQLFPTIAHDTALIASEPETVSFLLEFHVYTLSLSSLSPTASPDSVLAQDIQLALSAIASIERPQTGMLLGCAHDLFAMIPYATAGPIHWSPDDLRGGPQNIQEIQERVLSWSPPQNCSQTWATAGKLYQLALLLLLEESDGVDEAYITEVGSYIHIEDFVSLLESLEVCSEITTTLCWPLAVAGFHAHAPRHRQAIDTYLSWMVAKYGFGNLTQLRQLLSRFWAENSGPMAQNDSDMTGLRRKGLNNILFA